MIFVLRKIVIVKNNTAKEMFLDFFHEFQLIFSLEQFSPYIRVGRKWTFFNFQPRVVQKMCYVWENYVCKISALYLKNSLKLIILKKLILLRKGPQKNFPHHFFSCGPVIIWTCWCEKNTWKIEKSSICIFYDFLFWPKMFLTEIIW